MEACLDLKKHYGRLMDITTEHQHEHEHDYNEQTLSCVGRAPAQQNGNNNSTSAPTPAPAPAPAFSAADSVDANADTVLDRTDLLSLGCYIADKVTWCYDPILQEFVMSEALLIHDLPAKEIAELVLSCAQTAAELDCHWSILERLDDLVAGKCSVRLPAAPIRESGQGHDAYDSDPSPSYIPDGADASSNLSAEAKKNSGQHFAEVWKSQPDYCIRCPDRVRYPIPGMLFEVAYSNPFNAQRAKSEYA